jgi:hypothetical protein
MMEGKIIFERVPIFGEVKINLKKESQKTFEYFSDELNRLKGIKQLGILHEFLNIPPYRRYDYVTTMFYLIERATQYNENTNFDFNSVVKLKQDIKFSSSEQLLKTWCLLYSIGHLEMTFASEHAFIRYINENKEDLLTLLKLI